VSMAELWNNHRVRDCGRNRRNDNLVRRARGRANGKACADRQLYPQHRTWSGNVAMSQKCQKRKR
jgi:hypothetical protein